MMACLVYNLDSLLPLSSTVGKSVFTFGDRKWGGFPRPARNLCNFIRIPSVLQELSYLPYALPCRFIFSSETDSITPGESQKPDATFWIMVG